MDAPRRRRRDREPLKAADAPLTAPTAQEPTHADIAMRAYDLYQRRGGDHGHDWDDWFRAEGELRRLNIGDRDVAA
jgi:hypothetical protein